MSGNFLKKALSTAFLSLLLASTNYAQHTSGKADLVGTVRDSEGGILSGLSGVTITLINPFTGAKKKTITDDKGAYSFSTIEPGNYDIVPFGTLVSTALEELFQVNLFHL